MSTKTKTVETAAVNWLNAKAASDAAELALKQAREALIEATDGVPGTYETIVGKVSIAKRLNRTFDIKTLKEVLTPHRFRQVTEPKVVPALFDAEVRRGTIAPGAYVQVTESIVIKEV